MSTRTQVADRLQRSVGALSTSAMSRMETDLPWFGRLGAEDRSWVGLVVQAGIRAFVDWYREAGDETRRPGLAADVFGAAPRTLAGVINLQQTVDLVRLSIDVVEQGVEAHVDPADLAVVRAAVLRYAREVAFATAQVHARAAEVRGAWDARLEALVVDAVLRSDTDEAVLSRASALGWANRGDVVVVIGSVSDAVRHGTAGERQVGMLSDAVRRTARAAGLEAICAVQGDRLVVVLGGVDDPDVAAAVVEAHFGAGPVVTGPSVPDLAHAHTSARAAVSGLRVAAGWPGRPRPVTSADLLPERALAGDGHARRALVAELYAPLTGARGLLETLTAYFEHGASIEATARALFVHPNTVRYRLKAATTVTGLDPADARDAFCYQIAFVLGRLREL